MPRRILQGTVVSKKMLKTLIVEVERIFKHPLYGKTVKRSKRYAVHNPEEKHAEGDLIKIVESKPISRTKKWQVCTE